MNKTLTYLANFFGLSDYLSNFFSQFMTDGDKQTVEQKVLSDKEKAIVDAQNASRSQRQMRIDRGQLPAKAVGDNRIYRNYKRAKKAANRFCNNLHNPGSVGHNPRRYEILVKRQNRQMAA